MVSEILRRSEIIIKLGGTQCLNVVADTRMVWINVHEIPLHMWDEPLFKMTGDLFGKFVDFDGDTIGRNMLDVARIKVETM